MDVSFNRLFAFVKVSTGRRLSIYNQLRPIAQARGLADLVAHIDRAETHDRATRALENQWAAPADRAIYADEVRELDAAVDHTLTGMRDIARLQADGLDPGDPVAVANDRLQGALFPAGVRAIVHLPYVEQVAAVEVIVAALPGFSAEVALLGLQARVARLIALTAAYRAAVDALPVPLAYATVRDSQQRGQALLLEITARIAGRFYDEDDDAHMDARRELLAPILVQLEIVRANNRARRRGADVEPSDPGADEGPGDAGAGEAGAPSAIAAIGESAEIGVSAADAARATG